MSAFLCGCVAAIACALSLIVLHFAHKNRDHKPLMRTQFAMPSQNPAANFPLFAALVQWLMASQGHFTEQWDLKFTDPNVTVTNMST